MPEPDPGPEIPLPPPPTDGGAVCTTKATSSNWVRMRGKALRGEIPGCVWCRFGWGKDQLHSAEECAALGGRSD